MSDLENLAEDLDDELVEGPPRKYRAINGLAVASFAFGVLSAATVAGWTLAIFPILGIALAWLAFRRYRRNPEEQTGMAFARWGLGLSLGLWAAGWGYLAYLYYTEAPPGYEPVEYRLLQANPDDPHELAPPEAEQRHGKKIYLRGYMMPGRQRGNLRQFVLVDDPGACTYCAPKPRTTQLVLVRLVDHAPIEYTTHQVGVGGVFTVHKGSEEGMGGLLYKIEADVIK